MHNLQTIVIDVRGVCLSVCLSRGFTVRGSLGAAFVKSFWPLAIIIIIIITTHAM